MEKTVWANTEDNRKEEMNIMKKMIAIILAMVMCTAGCMTVFAAEAAQPATADSYQVTIYFNDSTQGAPLYMQPGTGSGVYFNIPVNTSLRIETVSSGWGRVTYNGCTGWIMLHDTKVQGDYPTPQPGSGQISPVYYTVYATEGEGLEHRTAPTTDASTFGPLYDGTVFKAEAQSGEWVYGENAGHYGWCHTAFLRQSSQDEITRYEAEQAAKAAQQPAQEQAATPQPVYEAETFPADNGYAQAYMDIINGDKEWIDQFSIYTNKVIVLSNVYGDEIPELIYITTLPLEEDTAAYGMPAWRPELHVVTFENETARELYVGDWGKSNMAGGYFFYYLFRMSGKPSLYLYKDTGDDGGRESYGRLDDAGDGTMTITTLFEHKYPYEGSGLPDEYYKKGEPTSKEDYDSGILKAQTDTTAVLMYYFYSGNAFVDSYVAQNGCPAMTTDEAIAYLASLQGGAGNAGSEEQPQEAPADGSGVVISF